MAIVESVRIHLKLFVTHRFKLDQIEEAYKLFGRGATAF